MLFLILKKIKFRGKLEIIDYMGNHHIFGDGEDFSKVRFTNKSIERKLFRNPSLYLGEGYMYEDIIIEEGTLDDFIKVITSSYDNFVSSNSVFRWYVKIVGFLKPLHQINKLVKSKKKCSASL